MVTKQFQYEPKQAEQFPSAQKAHTARFHSETKSRFGANRTAMSEPGLAAVPSMMLGLLLRGWLADSEKLFLDRLAPHKSITFLIQGKHYLHPEDVPLFPYELIETAIRQKTTAVFTHLFCPSTSRETHRYKIMTAVINPDADSPIVFGLFGPEPVISEPQIENRFMNTAACFRQAYSTAKAIVSTLGNTDHEETSLLVINRASGRLLYLSPFAAGQCDTDEKQLVDAEFSQVRDALGDLILGKKLQIRNIAEGDLNLSVVTLEGAPRPDSDNAHLAGFLLQKLREQLDHKNADGTVENKSLLRNIDELQLVLEHGSQSASRVNLLYELDQAVTNMTAGLDPEYPVRLSRRATQLYCQAQADSYRNLFEAILSAHGAGTPAARGTTITVTEHNSGSLVTVRFATAVSAAQSQPAFSGGWDEFATGLARMLGADIAHRQIESDRKLKTEITIETTTSR